MAAKTRSRRRKASELIVPRELLVDRIYGFVCRSGGVVLDAMPGSGRHCLAKEVINRFRALEGQVVSVELAAKSSEARLRKLRKYARQTCELRSTCDNVMLVIDGMAVSDELEAARLAHVVGNLIRERCRVLVIATPVSDMVFELLPDLPVFRAADLVVDEAEFGCWSDVAYGRSWQEVVACTHGIPSLVSCMKVLAVTAFGDASGSAWNEVARGLLASVLSEESILEERRLACAVLLLGSGSLYEVRELGVRVSPDIVAGFARDAPVLGLKARSGSFAVVPCDTAVLIDVARESYGGYLELVGPVLSMLMRRGDARRAGGIIQALEGEIEPTLFVLAHSIELVDAGFAMLVHRHLSACRDECGPGDAHAQALRVFAGLAERVLKAIGYLPQGCSSGGARGTHLEERANTHAAGLAESAEGVDAELIERLDEEAALVGLLGVGADGKAAPLQGEASAVPSGPMFAGRLARTLSLHQSVRRLLWEGRAIDAFRSLLAERDLRDALRETPSVFGARLQYDFELVRRLMEDAEAPEDRLALRAASEMLRVGGCTRLWDECECLLWVAGGQARLPADSFMPERGLSFARAKGDDALVAWMQLGLAAVALRSSAPRQVIVRVQEVLAVPKERLPRDARAMAFSLAILALSAMGELGALGTLADVPKERAEGEALDDRRRAERVVLRLEVAEDARALLLAQLALCATGDEGAKASSIAQVRLKSVTPRVEVIGLASLLCRLDASHGVELSQLLPVGWRGRSLLAPMPDEAVATAASDAAEQGRGRVPSVASGTSPVAAPAALQRRPKVSVSVLGSFSVAINGSHIPESAWHRRNARILLALLALSRGHVMTRSAIGEALWPESEYARARQNVYTALSALRSVLGQRSAEEGPIVGKTGRVWLDPDVVICDVDEFESMARRAVARGVADAERIELCRRLDGMYRGGTVVAADDGLGLLERRHEEVSQRYVNALRSGVSAAIRLDEGNQAVWLAESAAIEAPDREDVVESLIAAYKAAGREEDAKRIRMKGVRASTVEQTGRGATGKGAAGAGSGPQRRRPPKM